MTLLPRLKPRESCLRDAVALGEVMLRLDPGEGRIRSARQFQVWEGGGEYNVARGLAKTFGLRSAVVTALPRSDLGALVHELILQGGVSDAHILWREADPVGRENRVGLNFTERGFGPRGALGVSDRARSAASALRPDEIDWDALFGAEGVRWFHTGGIFSALSEATAETALAAVKAARRHGTVVSYDLNYRASLWAAHPDPEAARRVNRAIAEQVDVLIGDEYSLAACLGIETPEVRTDPCDPAPFAAAAERLTGQLPNLRLLASPLRDPVTASMNRWGACAWADGALTVKPPGEVAILDRVGGGDGFVSGLAFGLMDGRSLTESLALGVAHGALAMTTPGDNAMTSLDEVEALARGGSAAARR